MAIADMRDRRNPTSGFTLLELLIVVAILGLILAALSNGVRFAGQAWQVQERQSTRQGDLDAVQSVIRNLIASGTALEGDSTSLRFASELPRALARGGLYEVDLHAVAGSLLLTWRPHFKDLSNNASDTKTELVKGVTGFELAYYMQARGWQRVSKAGTDFPTLVRIDIQLRGDHPRPPLVVAPMIDTYQLH